MKDPATHGATYIPQEGLAMALGRSDKIAILQPRMAAGMSGENLEVKEPAGQLILILAKFIGEIQGGKRIFNSSTPPTVYLVPPACMK